MTGAAKALGWHPFPGPAAINSERYQDRIAVHVPRLLQSRRLPRGREERPERHDDSARAEDRPPEGRHRGARHQDRDATTRAASPASPTSPARRSSSSRRRWCCSRPTPTRTRGCCCSRRRRRSRRDCRTITARWGATTCRTPRRVGHGALPLQPEQLVRPAGAGRGGRQLGRRQLRPRRARLHRRRQPVGVLGSPADRRGEHEHLRPRAGVGHAVEGVREGERRPRRTPPTCRRRRCPTRTTTSTSIRW